MKITFLALSLCAAVLMAARADSAVAGGQMSISKHLFGKTPDGKSVDLYTLSNRHGMTAQITNYGGVVTSLKVPDREGKMDDVVLGFDTLDEYIKSSPLFGALVGRYANRIRGAEFKLGGKTYDLSKNSGPNHIHGGRLGFDKVVWQATPIRRANAVGVSLRHFSPDGHEGFPGNLVVKVVYLLTDRNELKIEYTAVTDKPTVVNFTHHGYFNLAGAGSGDVLNQLLTINANSFTPIASDQIPSGEVRSVAGTPLDFRRATPIGARINADDEQLKLAGGYDFNYVLNRRGIAPSLAARVYEPRSGRSMAVYTTEPGMVLYTGNFLNNVRGKGGKVYNKRSGLCLETGHFPDAPNHAGFPSTTLEPGQTYRQTTIYRFFAR